MAQPYVGESRSSAANRSGGLEFCEALAPISENETLFS